MLLEKLHILVRLLKKNENEPGDCIFVVYKYFLIELTDYFLTMIDKKKSKQNPKMFTAVFKKLN